VEVYLHAVWATWRREPYIVPEIERPIYRCIESEIESAGARLLAIGGVEDHINILVKIPATIAIAKLMNQVKGVSSRLVHDHYPDHELFRWQENYGVFSVGRTQVRRVQGYVQGQKQHHAEGALHARWEETDEEAEP